MDTQKKLEIIRKNEVNKLYTDGEEYVDKRIKN